MNSYDLLKKSQKITVVVLSAVCAVCLNLITVNASYAQDIFTVNTADSPPYSTENEDGVYDRIILMVFGNIGMKVKINHLDSARSVENVDVGLDDAEYARIKGLSNRYHNLRVVDEKLIDFSFTAFSKDSSIIINGWDSLKNYHVAYMRGWKIYEKNVKNTKSVLQVTTEKELFQLLENDRVDIILYELLRGHQYLKDRNVEGIYPLSNPLSVKGMYLYVNKKHDKLIPDIEQSLRAMKERGEYKNIVDLFNK